MKTTLEIPDPLYRQLKMTAAQKGKTVRSFVNDALIEQLREPNPSSASKPAWTRAAGGLKHLRTETRRIEKIIQREFSKIDREDGK